MRQPIDSPPPRRRRAEHGFSLLELVVALSILLTGLLGLAQVFYLGMIHSSTSSSHLIAREKAREAIESVHTARDTRTLSWDSVRNLDAPTCTDIPDSETDGRLAVDLTGTGGGIFLNGEQELLKAGPDGLVNTADDDSPEELPGRNGIFEDAGDDVALDNFFRTIEICDVNPNLRQIRVTVRYTVGLVGRSYTLTTYISSFS